MLFWGEVLPDLLASTEALLEGRDSLSGLPALEALAVAKLDEATELDREDVWEEDRFREDCWDVDIFSEVLSEVDRFSRAELSLRNSLAELSDLGGEIDLEDVVDDFLEAMDDTEAFLDDVVEDFLSAVVDALRSIDDDVAEVLLPGAVWPTPSLIIPRLMASSRAISLPVSGSVNTPVASLIRPLLSASWKVMAPSPLCS